MPCDFGIASLEQSQFFQICPFCRWPLVTNNFIERVRPAHRPICREIEHEQQRKVPESKRLVQLKKVRLVLKDRLARL